MAIKGLSRFVVAKDYIYDQATNKVSYDEVVVTERMISYTADISVVAESYLYCDNAVGESAGGYMSSGTLTIGTDELGVETSKALLNVREYELDGKPMLEYTDRTDGKIVGCAVIEEHQKFNETFYRAVILPKVKFSVPSGSAETRGDSVSWQTPEITASILMCDVERSGERPWKYTSDHNTEAEALAHINAFFDAGINSGVM